MYDEGDAKFIQKSWGEIRVSRTFWTFGVMLGTAPAGGCVAAVYFWRWGALIYFGGSKE